MKVNLKFSNFKFNDFVIMDFGNLCCHQRNYRPGSNLSDHASMLKNQRLFFRLHSCAPNVPSIKSMIKNNVREVTKKKIKNCCIATTMYEHWMHISTEKYHKNKFDSCISWNKRNTERKKTSGLYVSVTSLVTLHSEIDKSNVHDKREGEREKAHLLTYSVCNRQI